MLSGLRVLSAVLGREEAMADPDIVTIMDRYGGLWLYLQDPDGAYPEILDTDSLRRSMRSREYTMWPVDRA